MPTLRDHQIISTSLAPTLRAHFMMNTDRFSHLHANRNPLQQPTWPCIGVVVAQICMNDLCVDASGPKRDVGGGPPGDSFRARRGGRRVGSHCFRECLVKGLVQFFSLNVDVNAQILAEPIILLEIFNHMIESESSALFMFKR